MELRTELWKHLATDPRFVSKARKAIQESGLLDLHNAVCNERPLGGPAFKKYIDAWNGSIEEKNLTFSLIAFVREELKLPWPWLVLDLKRIIFMDLKTRLPEQGRGISIEYGFVTPIVSRARYQKFDIETLRMHADWYYRNKVKQPKESVRAIAKQCGRDWTSVRDAIKGVRRLLAELPQVEFPPTS